MTLRAHTLTALIALLGTTVAVPASAQGIVKASVSTVSPAKSACARDLKSVACGLYQDRILRTEAQRPVAATDAAATRDLGRRQLDALIATIG